MEDQNALITPASSGENTPDTRHRNYKWGIAIELPLFLIMFGVSISDAPITNVIMYRTCVHSLEYPVDKCRSYLEPGRTNATHDIEENVQRYATFISTVKSVLESLLPAVLSLFMIAWSDRHGRKPMLIWPIFGITLTGMMVVVYNVMDFLGPWWFIMTCVPYSLTGKLSILTPVSICYVTDITNEEERSIRLMIIQGMFGIGMALGTMVSPYLLSAVGTTYLLLIVAAIMVLAFVYTILLIEESLENIMPGNIWTALDLSLVKELFREFFKSRPNKLRTQIVLVTVANSLDAFTMCGISGLGYLYTRKVLHWSLQDYTQFSSMSIAIVFVGSFIALGILQSWLCLGDLPLSIISYASTAVQNFIKAFAVADWQMYLASIVSSFGGISPSLTKSYVSKILPSEDVAKVFALMCAIEGLCPLLAPVVFNMLYATTISILPGVVFMVTGAGNVICTVLLGFVVYMRWRLKRSNYAILQTEE